MQLPTAYITDANVEAEIRQVAQNYVMNKRMNQKIGKPILTSNWNILKNEYGEIEGKYIEAALPYKDEKGICGYFMLGCIKPYIGGGTYSNTIQRRNSGRGGRVTCDKIKF